jgi:hypothetical protein
MSSLYSNWLQAERSDDRGSILGGDREFLSSGIPTTLLSNEYRERFPWG